MQALPVDASERRELWGLFSSNPIQQTSFGPNVVVNQTLPGHILHGNELGAGTVVRWIGADTDGNLRIYTYGYGPNSNRFLAIANLLLGNALFGGLVNPVNEAAVGYIYSLLKAGVKISWQR